MVEEVVVVVEAVGVEGCGRAICGEERRAESGRVSACAIRGGGLCAAAAGPVSPTCSTRPSRPLCLSSGVITTMACGCASTLAFCSFGLLASSAAEYSLMRVPGVSSSWPDGASDDLNQKSVFPESATHRFCQRAEPASVWIERLISEPWKRSIVSGW